MKPRNAPPLRTIRTPEEWQEAFGTPMPPEFRPRPAPVLYLPHVNPRITQQAPAALFVNSAKIAEVTDLEQPWGRHCQTRTGRLHPGGGWPTREGRAR